MGDKRKVVVLSLKRKSSAKRRARLHIRILGDTSKRKEASKKNFVPHGIWERGSNENQNRLVRRHYPKGCNFDKVTPSQINSLQKWINEYPRKLFDYRSSSDLFALHFSQISSAC